MATIQIKGFVYAEETPAWMREEGNSPYRVHVLPNKSHAVDVWGICVGEIDVPYELPEGFDLAAEVIRQKIAALEAEREEASRKFAETVARINAQLANLQAIEYAEAA